MPTYNFADTGVPKCNLGTRDEEFLRVVEYTVGPLTPNSTWVMTPPSTSSTGEIVALTSGSSVSVRVHASGTHGVVGPSAIAGPKIVP